MGVFAAYATTRGHALVDRELYLPTSWTDDRERCRAARIPDERDFVTKNDLARAMILRAQASALTFSWVTADSAYGQDSRFRRFLEDTQLPTSLRCPSPSRFTARASTTSSPRPRRKRGSACPPAPARRANASTTGPPPACPRSGSSTAMNPPGSGGCWPDAASPSRTRSRTTSLALRWKPPSPTWSVLPAAIGRSRSASRARRTSAAWTTTRFAVMSAGTGTSRSPCSPTSFSRRWLSRNAKWGW
ncbi:transposase [Streptomyces sp. TX20-6-3]|uniref:transposase n=1 Tax=Streptomyces sp. TX20-6-3 TaxID=3028705 RepID=UPI0034DE496B